MRRSFRLLAFLITAAVSAVTLTLTSRQTSPSTPPTHHTPPADEGPEFTAGPRSVRYYVPPASPDAGDAVAEAVSPADPPESGDVGAESPRARKGRKAGAAVSVSTWAPRTNGTQQEYLADALFRRLDADGNGLLTGNEIPTELRGQLGSRRAIDRAAFVKLFQAAVRKLRAELPEPAPAGAGASAGSHPPMPRWFKTSDTDGDGQVSLSEWRAAGRSLAEFQQIDTNKDGLLTRQEVQAFAAQSASTPKGGMGAAKGEADKLTALPTDGKAAANGKKPTSAQLKTNALFAHYVMLAAGGSPNSRSRLVAGAPAAPAAGGAGAGAGAPAPAAPAEPERETATVALPLTDTQYWIFRDEQNQKALDAKEPPNVLFLGDSITDFLQDGAGEPLWDAFYKPLPALNFAIGGVRTSHVLWQLETGQVARAAPKVVVLLIGSNNLGIAGQEPEEVAEGIEKIVDELGFQLPKTRVLLLGILPRVDTYAPSPDKINKVNSLIADLHDGQRVFYRDIGSTFLSPDGSISEDVMPDGAHPSLWGYELYSKAVWPSLTGLLK